MKQKLFTLVGIAALMASCTSEDLLENGQAQQESIPSDGIVFSLADDAMTRGDFKTEDGQFYTAWNAETDRIGVIYSGVKKAGSADATKWCDVSSAVRNNEVASPVDLGGSNNKAIAVYKSTTTGTRGYFTAINDDNVLTFADEVEDPATQVKGSFRVFRPVVDGQNQTSVNYTRTTAGVETMAATVKAFATQSQTTSKVNFDNFFMVSKPIDDVYSATDGVGESIKLEFERPFSALAVRTQGYDKDVYGNLKTVTVTTTTSTIAYSDAVTVDIAKKVDGKWAINTEGKTAVKEVKLNVNPSAGTEWSDDYYAYIQIMPIERSAAEKYTVKLTFDNGDVTVEKNTTNNWPANAFVKVTVDLDAQPYTYLSTKNKLIVNSAMPTLDADKKFEANGQKYTATSITEFVSNVALSANDLKILKEFANVTNMTLANQAADLGDNLANLAAGVQTLTLTEATTAPVITSYANLTTLNLPKVTAVPASAFKGNTVLTSVSMPLVQTIGDNAFEGATGLKTIGCNTENIIIGTTKDGVKTSALTSVGENAFNGIALTSIDAPELTTVPQFAFGMVAMNNMSKVLLPKYGFDNIINNMVLLSKLAASAEVDLSGVDNLEASLSIAGTNVKKVILKEGANVGASVFAGCKSLAEVVNIDKVASFGESSFSGTKIATLTINIENIGKDAFKGCTSLASLVLGKNVKNIGEGAFSGCSNLTALTNQATIATIGKEAFMGTKITQFTFFDAALGEGAFQNSGITGTVISNVTTLEKNVFNGVKATSFTFPNAAEIGEGALDITTTVAITFNSALTKIAGNAFCTANAGGDGSSKDKAITGSASNMTLNLADKTGVEISGNAMTFKAADDKYYTITFAAIN